MKRASREKAIGGIPGNELQAWNYLGTEESEAGHFVDVGRSYPTGEIAFVIEDSGQGLL